MKQVSVGKKETEGAVIVIVTEIAIETLTEIAIADRAMLAIK